MSLVDKLNCVLFYKDKKYKYALVYNRLSISADKRVSKTRHIMILMAELKWCLKTAISLLMYF